MKVSKEELLHIANLADLILKEEEQEGYLNNLTEILNFCNIVNNADVEDLDITIGANKSENVFRKDEVKTFENIEEMLKNAPDESQNMYKVPKVVN